MKDILKCVRDQFSDNPKDTGFALENSSMIFLFPLLEVAWAEGFLQGAERDAILRVAGELGVSTLDETAFELDHWLKNRPPEELFDAAAIKLREWLSSMPHSDRKFFRSLIFNGCLEVARASPIIGFSANRVSPIRIEEQQRLEKIRKTLGLRKPAKLYE